MQRTAALILPLALVLTACFDTGGTAGAADALPVVPATTPLRVAVRGGDDLGRTAAAFVNADLDRWDAGGRLRAAAPALTIELRATDAAALGTTVANSYRLSGGAGSFAVAATDLLGLQSGAYELLERAGFLFYHPLEAFFPKALDVDGLGSLDELREPSYVMRGTHMRTMHPIEYEEVLLGNDRAHLDRFHGLLAWLVARHQNYLEWNLLRTVDDEPWLDYAGELVELAHARGIRMGIVAPFAFAQQNSYMLLDPDDERPHNEQIAAQVDWLMQADWDFVNVEMGASEFFPVSDVDQVAWLSFLATYMDEAYGRHSATKVHISSDQHAPSYDNINFNYVAQFADPRMGVMPHTVQFYDLYRPAPTYGRTDNDDMREFLLSQIGKRPVYYYPETAYWVTFDHDVPIYLPQYMYARWNDLHRLRDSGMDGQINFSSGYEWGYWQNDFVAAWAAFDAASPFAVPLARVLQPLGDAVHAEALDVLDRYTRWQGDELLVNNGIRWLIAWDAADDIGHAVDIYGQPVRVRLFEVADMDAAALEATAAGELRQIAALAADLQAYADAWAALAPRVAPEARHLYHEIRLGMEITARRARYVDALYQAVVARRRAELGLAHTGPGADEHFAAAEAEMAGALKLVRAQEAHYRLPHAEIAQDRPSRTSYPFGYLRTVTDLWYWQRELDMARDPDDFNFLDSLYDLVESGGF